MRDQDHAGGQPSPDGGGDGESDRKQRALKEILAESGREQEGVKSVLVVVVQKGLLILSLFVVCSLFNPSGDWNLTAMLIFVIGTVLIVVWRSPSGRP